MDGSDVVESLLTGTPVRQQTRSSSPRPSSGKKRNGILQKLFCSDTDNGFMGCTTNDKDLVASPPEKIWGTSLEATPMKPFKTPGPIIPSPTKKDLGEFSTPRSLSFEEEEEVASKAVISPTTSTGDKSHDVDAISPSTPSKETELPAAHEPKTAITTPNDDDDAAFLPDDVRDLLIKQASSKDISSNDKENNHCSTASSQPKQEVLSPKRHEVLSPKGASGMVPISKVQGLIDDAVDEAKREWKAEVEKRLEDKNAEMLEAMQVDAEKELMEHGVKWNIEHEEEMATLRKEMEEKMEQQRLKMEQERMERDEQQQKEMETRLQQQRIEMEQEREEAQAQLRKEMEERMRGQREAMERERDEEQRKWQESTEKMRSEFLDRIFMLVLKGERDAGEREHQLTELRAEKTAVIEQLEKDVGEHKARLQREEASLIESTQENTLLAARITALESNAKMMEEEKESDQQAHTEEVQRLKESMESELELSKRQLMEASRIETEELQSKIARLEEEANSVSSGYEEQLKTIMEAHKSEVEKREADFDACIENEKQKALEAQAAVSEEKTGLITKIEMLEASLVNEQEARERECKDQTKEIGELKDSFESERKEWQTSLESKQSETQDRYKKQIEEVEERLAKQRLEFEKEKDEIMSIQRDAITKEAELSKRLASLEGQGAKDKGEYTKKLQQVRDQHTAEIEELLAQLDLVEAEHNQKYEAQLESVKQKEAVIAALGAQLAEATTRTQALEAERDKEAAKVAAVREEAELARAATKSLQSSLERLRDDHTKSLEEEKRKVEKETIAAAEQQFEVAYKTYVKLKDEYDSVVMKLDKVERELKSSKRELDICRKENAGHEVEMRAELAQLKAALATVEADSARRAKDCVVEVEGMRCTQRDLEEKLVAETSKCKSSQDALALVVAEKEKVMKENNDLKAVCEELMAMVEGGQTG